MRAVGIYGTREASDSPVRIFNTAVSKTGILNNVCSFNTHISQPPRIITTTRNARLNVLPTTGDTGNLSWPRSACGDLRSGRSTTAKEVRCSNYATKHQQKNESTISQNGSPPVSEPVSTSNLYRNSSEDQRKHLRKTLEKWKLTIQRSGGTVYLV